ncbi:unknown [Peptostreptococcus anaerobius CAG:621]|uniref:hypothetical protein n=1 Tax=Peptostreptococcus anaerobius TaxID=1261 RepID=UPI00033AB10A|nr:hypothetical protein [Peptostreptococcus anaerobius]CCY48456.1 unknown [Peptostreptococcus anaerobius CAG:621]
MILNDFGIGVYLTDEKYDSCVKKVVEALKSELPEEAQTIGVITSICNDVIDHAKSRKIYL